MDGFAGVFMWYESEARPTVLQHRRVDDRPPHCKPARPSLPPRSAPPIDVVDSKEDKFWFIGQALVGPIAFGVDYYHQNHLKVVDTKAGRQVRRTAYPTEGRDAATGKPVPGGNPPNTKSVSKINELGMLSCCLAGMLNLIVVIDAGWPTRRKTGGA